MIYDIINNTPESAFLYFINNCKFDFFMGGNNGITIIAELNEGIDSCYKYINLYNFNLKVNKILLKIVLIKEENEQYDSDAEIDYCAYNSDTNDTNNTSTVNNTNTVNNINSDKKTSLDYATEKTFIHEVNTQIELYFKTIKYFQPICPGICFAKIYEYNNENKLFLNKILHDNDKLKNINNQFGELFHKYGLIAMEFLESYKPLYLYTLKKKYTLYNNMSRYLLLNLAIETGYNHADFHQNNILINSRNNTYFDSIDGYPILIDFSWAEKIPEDKLDMIINYYNNGNYVDALFILYRIKRRDDIDLCQFESFDWFCRNINYNEKMINNIIIDNLVKYREISIKKIVDIVKNDKIMTFIYNNIKNNMFNGIK